MKIHSCSLDKIISVSSNEEGSCEKFTFCSKFHLVRLSNLTSLTFCRSVSSALCGLRFFVIVDFLWVFFVCVYECVCLFFNIMGTERRDWELIFKRQKARTKGSLFFSSFSVQAVWEALNPAALVGRAVGYVWLRRESRTSFLWVWP